MGLSGRARGAIVAGSLVAVICLPVPGAAVGVVSGTAVSSPGPSGPTSPGQQPKPPPPPPPPPAHQPTTWPVQSGDRGPLVAWVQQRLIWLGYSVRLTHVMDRATVKAVVLFRTKFGLGVSGIVTAHTWAHLSALTHTRGVLPASCLRTGLVLCIDKTQKSLRLVSSGSILLTVDARFGGPSTPTHEGTFRVYRKSRDHVSSLFHTSMPFAMFFAGGQAVHYSPYFHRDGYAGASHGCVNLHDKAVAASLFDRVPIGTRVVVYRS